MRQSMKPRQWQYAPLLTSGSSEETGMLFKIAHNEEFVTLLQEVKPSVGLTPRSGK